MRGTDAPNGHPLHPVAIGFPTLLLLLTPIFDLVGLVTNEAKWAHVSLFCVFAGAIAAAVIALPALVDWLALPRDSAEWRSAGVQLALLLTGVTTGIGSAVARLQLGARSFAALPFALVLASITLLTIAAWLGDASAHQAQPSLAPRQRRVPPHRPRHA